MILCMPERVSGGDAKFQGFCDGWNKWRDTTCGAFSHRTSTTTTALALTCLWGRTVLSPGRSRAPKQARSSPFHRLADSIIVTSDWPPERRSAHHRRQQSHHTAGAFRPRGWQARICRFDCYMSASQRRIPLSCHRICSPPPTRGQKICVISAQMEFLGGTGIVPSVGMSTATTASERSRSHTSRGTVRPEPDGCSGRSSMS